MLARVVFTRKVGLALPRKLSVENCTGVLLLARVVVCSIFTHATPNLIRTTSHLAGVTENWRETLAVRHMMTLDTTCITSTYYIHAACIRIVDARFLSKRSNPAQQWDSVIPTSSSFLLSRPSPTCDLGPAEGRRPRRQRTEPRLVPAGGRPSTASGWPTGSASMGPARPTCASRGGGSGRRAWLLPPRAPARAKAGAHGGAGWRPPSGLPRVARPW